MKWLPVPTDPRRLITIARLQNNLDFQNGWKAYLNDVQKELFLKSLYLKGDIEYRQNQGRLQVITDLLTFCDNAHDWALKAQPKK